MVLKDSEISKLREEVEIENKLIKDLRLFFGPNADKFMAIYHKKEEKKFVYSWSWVAFFFPVIWLLYRKMWIMSAVVPIAILVPIFFFDDAFFYLTEEDAFFYSLTVTVVHFILGVTAKGFYLRYAENKIKKINKHQLPEEERLEKITKAGGVSIWGGVLVFFKIAILIAIFGVFFWIVSALEPIIGLFVYGTQ